MNLTRCGERNNSASRNIGLSDVLHKLPYANKDIEHLGKLDSMIVGRAQVVYERSERSALILQAELVILAPASQRRYVHAQSQVRPRPTSLFAR
jgi:hypothetical protein